MDILGSALASPTVSWHRDAIIATKKSYKVIRESMEHDDDATDTADQLDHRNKSSKRHHYYSSCDTDVNRSLSNKLKQLLKRIDGSSEEVQPLVFARPKKKPIVSKEKLKTAGKRLKKALHKSIMYMAIGMENMSTMIYASTNLPYPTYHYRYANSYSHYDANNETSYY